MCPVELLQHPENSTVFLNETAVFTCETINGVPAWRVNGTILQRLPSEIRSDIKVSENNTAEGISTVNMAIPAKAEYNGTIVQCVILSVEETAVLSDKVLLNIQGTTLIITVSVVSLTFQVYCQQ